MALRIPPTRQTESHHSFGGPTMIVFGVVVNELIDFFETSSILI